MTMRPGFRTAVEHAERSVPAVAPDLASKVAFLSRPESYPGSVGAIERIETHMAWVFLAGDRAYKLKKPVRFSFLDYSTLDARRWICQEEVRLNRRLAPDVYLGTVALTQNPDGALELAGDGDPVEWLVAMRRLPPDRMLDHAVRARPVAPAEVAPVASLLADFFTRAAPEPVDPEQYVDALREAVVNNRGELAVHVRGRDAETVSAVSEMLTGFLETHPELLEERAAARRIVEGHGDLRPDHVFLGPPPAVIDCIEFSRAFRVQDPADELAGLAVELERLGAPALGAAFIETYRKRSGDAPPELLLRFYSAHRALLRARLAIAHLEDEGADRERWLGLGRSTLALAKHYAEQLQVPLPRTRELSEQHRRHRWR